MKKIFYLILISLLFVQCEKWNLDQVNFLEISTAIIDVNINEAEVESEVKGIKAEVVIQHGHVWSASLEAPTIQLNDGIDAKGGRDADGNFSSQLEDLDVNTVYYVRGFAETNDQVSYGNTIMISTGNIIVSTDDIIYLDADTARVYGNLCCVELDITVDQHGFCWSSTNDTPTIENGSVLNLGKPSSNGIFSGRMTELEDNTFYYYRSYAITNFGSEIVYGEVKTWETNLKNIWKKKKDFLETGFFFRGFDYGGKGYVFDSKIIWQYDSVTDMWTEISTKPGNDLYFSVPLVIGDYAYFMIGSDEIMDDFPTPNNLCWRFNLVTLDWEELNPFMGGDRVGAIGFAPGNGKAYIGMGNDFNSGLVDFWEYNPSSDMWDSIAPYPSQSDGVNLISFVIDGKGYVGGGSGSGADNLYSYNYQDDSWTPKNTLPGGETFEAVSFVIDEKAYIGTGESSGNASTKSFWSYDEINDTWTTLTDFKGRARYGAFGFAIGGKGYIGGGVNFNEDHVDFWEYKPKQD